MVLSCAVVGCSNRSDRDDRHYYRLPKVVTNQGKECEELSCERRRRWLAALGQDLTGKNLDNIRICSDHFVSGKKTDLYYKDSPNWVPTLKMGTQQLMPSMQVVVSRYNRRHERKRKTEAAKVLLDLSSLRNEESENTEISDSADTCTDPTDGTDVQTDMSGTFIQAMSDELQQLRTENLMLKSDAESANVKFSQADFEGNDEKVKYFTGLPSFTTLMTLFVFLEPFLPTKLSMDRFRCLILTVMRLRLNMSVVFLAYEFNVSSSTVSRIFTDVLEVLYIRMKPFVHWPDRETLHETMPMQFRQQFGSKCAVIIDCFEVFIERPSKLKSRAETWSSYKHHNTVKFLLGITPQGVISFISRSWGGRASDKHITENCGFLSKILPGDLVLADRGFDIASSLGTMSAQLRIPAFTKGCNQLSPLDVESTRKLANVRIHVERVIGLVRQKYTILGGTLPIDMLTCRNSDDIPTIDKIAHVCCALVNLCESVVSFD